MKAMIVATCLVLASAPLVAQGSGSIPSAGKSAAHTVVKDLRGSVDLVNLEERFVVVATDDGQLIRFDLHEKKTKVKADRNTALGREKKKLQISDLAAGQVVRVTYEVDAPGTAKEVKILELGQGEQVAGQGG